jgi:hypothetical protein
MPRTSAPALKLNRFLRCALPALALLGWGWAGEAGATRWGNGLPTSDLRYNALSANPEANKKMVYAPLSSALYALGSGDPVLRDQLEDPSARTFMKYVVSCALRPDQSLSWQSRTGTTYSWKGELGLCPEWASSTASEQCQRWVSACVLARNNALGVHVLFSARGNLESSSVLTPQPSVDVDPFVRLSETDYVASMLSCPWTTYGVSRSCGFQLGKVGHCSPGTRVELGGGGTPWDYGCPGPTLGSMISGDMVFRVCEGSNACDSSAALAQSEGSCSGILPAVSFTCPTSGTFSVLPAPYTSSSWGVVDIEAASASYPATEEQVYPIREGAFWGTIFGSGAVAQGVHIYVDSSGVVHGKNSTPTVKGSIYPKMFACQAPMWTDADAYATARLCTLPEQNCVATPLGYCNELMPDDRPRCELDNASGHGDYGKCTGSDGTMTLEVITPYLNQQCDLVSSPSACKMKQ